MRRLAAFILGLLALCVALPSIVDSGGRPPVNNGCSLTFNGNVNARKAVKLRSPNLNYAKHNNGNPISVRDFLQLVCPLNPQVPRPVPKDRPMDMEKLVLTVKGFVMAMKLDPDNDLHIQIGDHATPYKQPQIIVEIPPGSAYCDARTQMMSLFRTDAGDEVLSRSEQYVFNNPPKIEATGYLFLDSHHGASCTANGNRGIKNGLQESPVKGTWEIHPVISLRP